MPEQATRVCSNAESINPREPPVKKFRRQTWNKVRQRFSALAQDGAVPTLKKILNQVRGKTIQPVAPSRLDIIEVLNLLPGDLVEVKSEQEIRDGLINNRYKGLYFMDEMWKFCGMRFTVRKRVDTLIVESTQAMRKVKNTVILDDSNCDGSAHGGCGASCFHFWREAWLKKVD